MSLPTASDLEARLREALQPTVLEVIDESAAHAGHSGARPEGYGTHFRVRIASPLFAGKARVARHRLVCMMRSNVSSNRAFTRLPSRRSRAN